MNIGAAKVRLSVDSHLHSTHSVDGHSTIDEMCVTACEKNFNAVCFTEHVDMNPQDSGYGYFRFDKFSGDIERAREKFDSRLTILKGIEFSEAHLYPREFEMMVNQDFDYVLTSIHWIEGFEDYWNDEKRLLPGYPIEKLFNTYYKQVLKVVEFGGFDTLAHIDFPKRFLPRKSEPGDLLADILETMVKKRIALEINTSPIRKGYSEVHPSNYICDLYRKHGGASVTIGSDSHRNEEIGQDFDQAEEIIQNFGFRPVFFVQRKEKPL